MSPRILVTGATGKTGSVVVEELLGRNATVRALVHREDERSQSLASKGAEIVVADMFDPVQVQQALTDVQRLYYVPPWHPHMLHGAVTFATAARQEGVDAIVDLSQWLAQPDHPSLATRQNWLVDRLFDLVPDAAHVVVNPGFFADNYLQPLIGMAAQLGMLPIPAGVGRNAPPSNNDIARVVAATLLDPTTHDGATYRPTGPTLIDSRDMAAALTEVLGRRVRHIDMPIWAFMRALGVMGPRFGFDRFQQSGARYYYQEQKAGTWEIAAPNHTCPRPDRTRARRLHHHRPTLRHPPRYPPHAAQPLSLTVGHDPHRPPSRTATRPLRRPPTTPHPRQPDPVRTLTNVVTIPHWSRSA